MEHVLRHANDDSDIVVCDAIDTRFRLWSRLGSATQLQVTLVDLNGRQQYQGRLADENGKVMQSLSVLNSDTVRVSLSYGAEEGSRLNPARFSDPAACIASSRKKPARNDGLVLVICTKDTPKGEWKGTQLHLQRVEQHEETVVTRTSGGSAGAATSRAHSPAPATGVSGATVGMVALGVLAVVLAVVIGLNQQPKEATPFSTAEELTVIINRLQTDVSHLKSHVARLEETIRDSRDWSGMPPISTAAPELLPEATVNTMWSVVKTLIVNPVITIIIYFGWMIIAVTVACSCLCSGNRR